MGLLLEFNIQTNFRWFCFLGEYVVDFGFVGCWFVRCRGGDEAHRPTFFNKRNFGVLV